MKLSHSLRNIFITLSFLFLAGCSNYAPANKNPATTGPNQRNSTIIIGTITSVKNVIVQGTPGQSASTMGKLAGSILGSVVPHAGSIVGGIIGGAIGSNADREMSKRSGVEISVILKNGESVIVTQLASKPFRIGQKVKLILWENKARVEYL